MPINERDLSPAMRAKARELAGVQREASTERQREKVDRSPCPYRCVDCGWLFEWTTNADANPAHVNAHAAETGHARYEMVVTPVTSPR